MAAAQRHLDISDMFLDHAEEEFRKGDLLQAAEKAWGAVAHCMNGIARKNSWPLGTHLRLRENLRRLISRDMQKFERRRLLFISAESLHANFYQEFMPPESVRQGIDDARELVAALKVLADHSG